MLEASDIELYMANSNYLQSSFDPRPALPYIFVRNALCIEIHHNALLKCKQRKVECFLTSFKSKPSSNNTRSVLCLDPSGNFKVQQESTNMSNSEFPPSSPFLEPQQHDDPFNSFSLLTKLAEKKLVISSPFEKESSTKAYGYPTPNPSSSSGNNGRSSSPARHQLDETPSSVSNERETTPVATNLSRTSEAIDESKVQYTSPIDDALKIKLYSGQKISLGRSSRCDYFIKSKFASRVHLKVHYDFELNELTVLCKGYNGVVIQFGTTYHGFIKQLKENVYKFENDVSNKEEDAHTELNIFRDEQITVPYNKNISFNIKGHITLLEVVNDESETEDELPTLNTESMSHENRVVTQQAPKMLSPDVDNAPVQSSPLPQSKSAAVYPIVEVENAVTKDNTINTDPSPEASTASSQESTRDIKSNLTLKGSKLPEAPIRTPLQPKDENSLNKPQSRRRKAEAGLSPQKKKLNNPAISSASASVSTDSLSTSTPSHAPALAVTPVVSSSTLSSSTSTSTTIKRTYLDPREKISNLKIEEVLSTVEDLDSIKNLLSNHLAFSRLSQTPLKQLQTVSVLTQGLSRQQLRAVLASVECIGVIYRHGKDAAGKPLDEEYYYDVEKDTDLQRTQMVSSIKGSSGLRSCRKTHKQYFWKKPVTKK